jgi:hypothetical protein
MKHGDLDLATPADRALERETALVDSAVEMVATGHAVRMQLGGLAFGDALLDHARRTGAERGVRVTPHWGVGEEGLAMVFEPAGDGGDADTNVAGDPEGALGDDPDGAPREDGRSTPGG